MIKKYSWTVDGFYRQDPEQVAQELEQLDELTPENVLEAAKNEETILHTMFEWDDTIAGRKYRLQQARQIICNIRVQIIEDTRPSKEIKAFVQMKKQGNYEPIEVAIKDIDKYQILLEKAYKELNQVKNKYANLTEIQELLRDIPKV